jgi:hypothetical protein
VVAIDNSPKMLHALREYGDKLPIRIVADDLLAFPKHLRTKAHLIMCMGDTLPHLPDRKSIEKLFSLVAESLHPDGMFISTFRDYTSALVGDGRFIPVRGDNDRILTCFLEYFPGHVTVHDVLHERNGSTWQQRVSSYRKLRLSPEWVSKTLQAKRFSVHIEPGLAGMVRVVANRPTLRSVRPARKAAKAG